MTETTPPKKSDLGVRVLSAIVMVAVAGTALWLGGWFWTTFVAAIGLGILLEWRGLVRKFQHTESGQIVWLVGGVIYVGLAIAMLIALRSYHNLGLLYLLLMVLGVIGTDVGAYIAGRTIGGPKIAPSISPSKTWSGLLGGALGAGLAIVFVSWYWSNGACQAATAEIMKSAPPGSYMIDGPCSVFHFYPRSTVFDLLVVGPILAIIAQAGDFFESWMKRRAGVKDSGKLLPGHGGLFDRTDGLIAVLFVFALANFSLLRFAG